MGCQKEGSGPIWMKIGILAYFDSTNSSTKFQLDQKSFFQFSTFCVRLRRNGPYVIYIICLLMQQSPSANASASWELISGSELQTGDRFPSEFDCLVKYKISLNLHPGYSSKIFLTEERYKINLFLKFSNTSEKK